MTETVLPEKMKRRQAQELGLKKYFTGKPCKNGHLSERYIGGVCISCVDERNNTNKDKFNECRRKRHKENPQKTRDAAAEWDKKNPGRRKLLKKMWKENNPERVQQLRREWYDKNADHAKRKTHEWRLKNPEMAKKQKLLWNAKNQQKVKDLNRLWIQNNPEKIAEKNRNRGAKTRGGNGKHTNEDIKWLLDKQKYKCVSCGKSVKKHRHVDHIMPLARGGSNDKKNLQILCPTCNLKKNKKHPIDFMQENGFLL